MPDEESSWPRAEVKPNSALSLAKLAAERAEGRVALLLCAGDCASCCCGETVVVMETGLPACFLVEEEAKDRGEDFDDALAGVAGLPTEATIC